MGWFEELFGLEKSEISNNMTEKDIALDILKDSKFIINTMSMAITESSNPRLREILKKQFNEALLNHFRLTDLSIQNSWYQTRSTPIEQLKTDYQEVQTLTD